MKKSLILLGLVAVCATTAWGADPYIGYVYPAGAQTGTTIKIEIGGQRIGGVRDVYFSGKGVRATFVSFEGAAGPLNKLQQDELKRRLSEIASERPNLRLKGNGTSKNQAKTSNSNMKPGTVALPDLPELRDLESKNAKQLILIRNKFLNKAKRTKQPIAETATLEVTIDPDATPGGRELRLITGSGLSNPIIFQVGNLPEIQEPDFDALEARRISPATAPVVLNGQIMPGEVDSYPLELKQGQQLAIVAQARHLIPYLADAVPGWFQARLTLRDADGKDIASADHCGFDPDPVIFHKVTRDGSYTLNISDTLYRGRKDFVYRVVVAEEQASKSLFPTGSRGGVPIGAVDVNSDPFSKSSKTYSEFVSGDLTPQGETEPNNKGQQSQKVTLPGIIRGSIAQPGDVDVFKFSGHAGDEIVAEVVARRLGSPLDSLLRLISPSGRVVAFNDDNKGGEMALLTHRADSYLSAKLPATGVYYVQVSDAQQHGGSNYNYYLRISAKQPDFILKMSPSGVNILHGHSAPITVYAFRKDGWNGDIDVSLKNPSSGFVLSGGRIPAGRDSVQMTLTAPRRRSDQPIALQLEGQSTINGKKIVRDVVPTENMMQAFAWHHLVPATQLLAMVLPKGQFVPVFSLPSDEALSVPSGGRVEVSVSARSLPNTPIQLELNNPPAGITLQDVKKTPDGMTFVIKADSKHIGYADNLIVNAFTEETAKPNKTGAKGQAVRTPIGTLPAIPFRIVP